MHRLIKTTFRVLSYKAAFLTGIYVGILISDNGSERPSKYNLLENRVDQIDARLEYLETRRQNGR